MTRDDKFRDKFWDCEYNGSTGLDVLVKKMKDGNKMCKDLEDCFKQRTRHEEEYAKNLQKLARNMSSQLESGTLKQAWDEQKRQLEKIATQHFEVAKQLYDQSSRVAAFADKHKSTRKSHEDTVRAGLKKKSDLFKKNSEAKKHYHTKCHESELQDRQVETYINSKQRDAMKEQDWEKIIAKQIKARIDAEKSIKTYKDTLSNLEDGHRKWEQDMVVLCDEYENIEDCRIRFLRNELWVMNNISSQACVEIDNCSEEVRKCLEKCDEDLDITAFMQEKKVHDHCPGRIEYEAYLSPFTSKVWYPGGQAATAAVGKQTAVPQGRLQVATTGTYGRTTATDAKGRPMQPLPGGGRTK